MTLYVPERKSVARSPSYRVNTTHPAAPYLVFAVDAYNRFDILTGLPVSDVNGSPYRVDGTAKIGSDTQTANCYIDCPPHQVSDSRTYLLVGVTCEGAVGAGDTGNGRLFIGSNDADIISANTGNQLHFLVRNGANTAYIIRDYITISSSKSQNVCVSTVSKKFFINGSLGTSSASGLAGAAATTSTTRRYIGNRAAYDRSYNGSIGIIAVFNTSLPDELIQSLSENPWQLFAPRRQWFAIGSTGNTLRVPFKTSAGADDNIYLTTDNTLRFNNAAGYYDPIAAITV